jgi:hypothetical protein
VRDGSGDDAEFVVNGQKVWTTNAAHGDKIFAMVRTDQGESKHRGIRAMIQYHGGIGYISPPSPSDLECRPVSYAVLADPVRGFVVRRPGRQAPQWTRRRPLWTASGTRGTVGT